MSRDDQKLSYAERRRRYRAAEAKRRNSKPPPDNPRRAMRRCLGGCDGLFRSEGPQHRICPACAPLIEARRGGLDDEPASLAIRR